MAPKGLHDVTTEMFSFNAHILESRDYFSAYLSEDIMGSKLPVKCLNSDRLERS